MRQTLLAEDQRDTAQSHNLDCQGRYTEIERLYRRAVVIRQRLVGRHVKFLLTCRL